MAISLTEKRWTPTEEEQLYLMRHMEGLPYAIIAKSLDRTSESCRKKYNRTDWKNKSFYSKIHEIRENIYQDKKNATYQKILEARDEKLDTARIQADILGDVIERSVRVLPKVKAPVYRPAKKSKQSHESEDMGLMLSDLHIGHNHSFKDTGGLTQYNQDVLKARLEVLKTSVVDIVELHSALYEIPNLHIFCLGDIVAGMNAVGNWSNTFIDMDIMDQAMEGVNVLSEVIYYWLGLFKKIYFYGVAGNHGRCAPKNLEKHNANWDVVCYRILQAQLSHNDRAEFVVPDTWWIEADVKGHSFLLIHGDDVKSGPVAIKSLQNFVDKWAGIAGFVPEYTLAGHFHSAAELATPSGRLFINGSIVGADVFALKKLHNADPPEQKLFGIHAKRGVTWVYNIDLREENVKKS